MNSGWIIKKMFYEILGRLISFILGIYVGSLIYKHWIVKKKSKIYGEQNEHITR